MGAELPSTATHWFRQTEKRKGIRLDADQMDLLNAIGVGGVIAEALADYQRTQCQQRAARSRSINGDNSGSIQGEPDSTSSGTTSGESANEAAARARRTRERGGLRSITSTSRPTAVSRSARSVGEQKTSAASS